MDLKIAELAYFYGFSQADGHLYEYTRNRGRFSIELNIIDKDLLIEFSKLIPYQSSIHERIRDTNYKLNSHSAILNCHSLEFRNNLKELGFPVGKKHHLIFPPKVEFSEKDYIRGYVDGNGSMGISSKNIPFLSVTTHSDSFAAYFKDYLKSLNIVNNSGRNKRDNIYNICVFNENAVNVINDLYYIDCPLFLERKMSIAKEIKEWLRPYNRVKVVNKKSWKDFEDDFITKNPIEISAKELDRTVSSIKNRLYYLKHK